MDISNTTNSLSLLIGKRMNNEICSLKVSSMQKIHFTKQYTVEKKNRDLFGEALEDWFKTKAVYGIYKKFGRARSERVFNEMQKIDDHTWKHFMQRLHYD